MAADSTYKLVENGQAIECLVCHQVSWETTDVQDAFCGACEAHHPIRTEGGELARHCHYSIQELPARSWFVDHLYQLSPNTLANLQGHALAPVPPENLLLEIFLCYFKAKRLLVGMAAGRFNHPKQLLLSAMGTAVVDGIQQLPGPKTELAYVELGFPHPRYSVAEMVYDAMENCAEHSRIVLIGDLVNSLHGLITPLLGYRGRVRLTPSGRDSFETLDARKRKELYQASFPYLKKSFWHPDSGIEMPPRPNGVGS